MTLVFSIAFFYINTCKLCYCVTPFYYPFWVAVTGKANIKVLALVSPCLEKPKVRYVSDFNLGSFT